MTVSSVTELNRAVAANRYDMVIRTAEARHNRDLVRIADEVASCNRGIKLVLVAGPSSAGKTTFAKRLSTYLRVNGFKPFALSTDDYFVGDALTPRDEKGELDYEHLDAVDCRRLVADLSALMKGEAVRLRRFDFTAHEGFDLPEAAKLEKGGIIVLEGIHALNPALLPGLPDSAFFRIYINVLSTLKDNEGNPILAEDVRLLRRILRDACYRKKAPAGTLAMWPSVMRGEYRWINPFRGEAHAVFDTALEYELAVLKPFVETALRLVPDGPQRAESKRLLGILQPFLSLPSDVVAGDSILRETIGHSQLSY